MKKNYCLILICLFSITCTAAHATIWRVNNQLEADKSQGIFNQLNEVQEDVDVLPGDTIHLEGSPTFYNDFNCSKKLVIIGPGYFITENPESQSRPESARLSTITFNEGSEGSLISGIVFNRYPSSGPYLNVNNITIQRCFIAGDVKLSEISGARIVENYSTGNISGRYTSTVFSDIIVRNNIFAGDNFNTRDGAFSICENNIFTGNSIIISASSFRNNILTDGSATAQITSGNILNNLAANGQFGTQNGNQNVNIESVFMGEGSTDGKWQLSASSPAKGAGVDGIDAGAFGGDAPYVLSGIPSIPIIHYLRVSDSGNLENGIQIQIKVKAN